MPTNKRITAPRAAPVKNEIKIQMLVQTLEKIAKLAGKEDERCLKAGCSESTLSVAALKGRKSLLKREREKELVILGSDKSGERVVMDTKLYTEIMSQHSSNQRKG